MAHNASQKVTRFYYLGLALSTLLGIGYGIFFSDIFFGKGNPTPFEVIFNILKTVWIIPLPYALLNFYAFVRYPALAKLETFEDVLLSESVVYFRIVTRGKNPKLIQETVATAHSVLSQIRHMHWVIEVLTDSGQPLPAMANVVQLVVPSAYKPQNGTLYKGRALHSAVGQSEATEQDWIVHMDEETRFDLHTVQSIQAFIAEENSKPKQERRIGQGIIVYGRRQITNWITTLADSLRVGDDYGRFRLQFEHGRAYFGMHGSFIVISNYHEQQIGFDHGPNSSITEDAYFALLAQAKGIRFAFIHAFMYEQSPFTILDFVRQRRRWFGGLWLCVSAKDARVKDRIILATFMLMWSVSWLCLLMIYINFLNPTGTPVWLAVAGGVSFLYYVTLYLIGFFRTFRFKDGQAKFILILCAQVLLIPLFSAMEAAGVLYGLISPPKNFYVVKKEPVTSNQSITRSRFTS